MSLCDTCKDPGYCCRDIPIISFVKVMTPLEVLAYVVEQEWPFQFEFIDEFGRGRYSCPNLLPNGRCGDYENRPYICSAFEPAKDALCCHHVPIAPGCETHGTDTLIKLWSKELSS